MLLSIPRKVLTWVILNRMKVAVDEVLRDEQDLERIAPAPIKMPL